MQFNSINYIFCFLPSIFILYFLFNKFKLYKIAEILLLAASVVFISFYKTEYVLVLACAIIINYLISIGLLKNSSALKDKIIVTLAIILNILIILGFNLVFILPSIHSTIEEHPFNSINFIFPIVISFSTIHQISYLIDCYKGEIKGKNFLDYALYVLFFPKFAAGPITRYNEIVPQFKDLSKKVINPENIYIGICLIAIGLFQKTVLADHFYSFIDSSVNHHLQNGLYCSWFFSLARLLNTYFSFSAYCDMAMGSAYLFNIILPLNINTSFKAQSISEYWSRWDITMIKFLKDYIYTPIVKNSFNLIRICSGIIIVFLIYGLWQGSSLIYGILLGIVTCLNIIFTKKFKIKIPKVVSVFITFVTLLLLNNFNCMKSAFESCTILKSMFGFPDNYYVPNLIGLNLHFAPSFLNIHLNLFILVLSFYLIFISKNSLEIAKLYSKKNNFAYTIILAVILFISILFITKNRPFIYFNF